MPRYLNPPCHLKAGHQDISQSPRRGALTFGKGLLCPTLEKQQNPEPDLAEAASALKEQFKRHGCLPTALSPVLDTGPPGSGGPHLITSQTAQCTAVWDCIGCIYKWLCVGLNRFATQ